jgi:hypothetical protein
MIIDRIHTLGEGKTKGDLAMGQSLAPSRCVVVGGRLRPRHCSGMGLWRLDDVTGMEPPLIDGRVRRQAQRRRRRALRWGHGHDERQNGVVTSVGWGVVWMHEQQAAAVLWWRCGIRDLVDRSLHGLLQRCTATDLSPPRSSSSLPARSMAVDVAGDLLDESTRRGVDGHESMTPCCPPLPEEELRVREAGESTRDGGAG